MAAESPAADHQVWDCPIVRLGGEGLQLNKAIDQLSMQEVSRLANLLNTGGGDLTTRPGQTLLATLGGTVHSIRRLNNPFTGSFTRFWGAGTSWYRGASGVPSSLAAGFSGNPLTFVTTRPPFSGESWMVAADSAQMQKASSSSPSLPLGLPVPASLVTAIQAILRTNLCSFDSGDSTQAANWVGAAGYDVDQTTLAAAPTITDTAGISGSAINILTAPGAVAAGKGYLSIAAVPRVADASLIGGVATATDQDLIHLLLKSDLPSVIEEVRLYFVCSPFTAAITRANVPGTSATQNVAAYMRAFKPSDFAAFVATTATALAGTEQARQNTLLQGNTQAPVFVTPTAPNRLAAIEAISANNRAKAAAAAANAGIPGWDPAALGGVGAGHWTEYGIIGLPVRRLDFIKIGTAGDGTSGTDWSTITGIVITILTTTNVAVNVALDDCYLTGGYGPDTSEPGSQKYDYRVVNYDPRTGARSNGTPIQSGALSATAALPDLTLDALRQAINITPAAFSDGAIRQEAYRRGGSLVDNWYFVARNTANGGLIQDTFSDLDLANADVIPIDHFQPVATVDASGNTILAQPLPILFGPFDDGTICGLGDPYRPGHLYACLPGEVDHWPSTGDFAIEVCAPSEELLNGGIIGGSGFVLSRERGYTVHTNLAGGAGIVATPSGCTPGLAARWGFCVGPGGVFYVAADGVRVTNGGDSTILSDAIRPLFHAQTVNGYSPIDFSVEAAIRLAIYDTDLWFSYQDTMGVRQILLFSLVYHYWRPYSFASHPVACVASDWTRDEQGAQGALQLVMGSTDGSAYLHAGFDDAGTPIAWSLRTGAWNWGRPREEKRLGDLTLEADLAGATLTAQLLLNNETVTNGAQTTTGAAGRKRYTFDPFGTVPQRARTVSLDLSGLAPTTAPLSLALAGISYTIEPPVTMNRATTWEPLGPTEAYCYAGILDCDTGGTDRTILIEGDLAGVVTLLATLTVNSNGRHKLWFSWPAAHTQLIRVRPDDTCIPWLLYNVEWVSQPEPPRIAGWDTNFEDLGDTYYTGLDLEVDTFGQAKSMAITVDQVAVPGSPFTVQTTGRTHVHLTFTPGRGHIYHLHAEDANPGLLYTHKWIVVEEPLEQTNWNAPYTIWSSLSDKYLKGIVIEADTFNQAKSVNVEVDGVVLTVITPVTHNGRLVKNYTFPQVLGRVFRIIPTDAFPSRLYSAQPLFDEEPFALSRWETQLLDYDLPGAGWGSLLSLDLCLKSTAVVTVAVDVYNAKGTLLQTLAGIDATTGTAGVVSTGGAKQKRFVTFVANKGVLFKWVVTSLDGSPITVYQEESRLRVQPWSGGLALVREIGNDDIGVTRNMRQAVVAAARSGGGS